MNLLRLSTIKYLNPAPLLWDFVHPPRAAELAKHYAVDYTLPSRCAADLASGKVDVGLIPIASYATTPGLAIVPGCAIASLNHVRSIVLVVGHPDGITAVRSLAVDTSSRSSTVYAQILFRKFLGISPKVIPSEPNLGEMLKTADAALLIGDPALLALEHRKQIESSVGDKFQRDHLWLDLAAEWRARTGLPWVAAFWAARQKSLENAIVDGATLTADLNLSRDHGLEHVDDLVREWTPRIPLPAETIREYLTGNIHYRLDEACLESVNLFYKYAAELDILPPAPPLKFL